MNRIIPLRQHIGGPCKPIVKKNDKVKRGQTIAEPNGLGAFIHSPYSGTVESISENEITLKIDNKQTKDFVKISSKASNLEKVKLAGIVGSGGAGFPTHIKLDTKEEVKILMINAAECEPMLGHNILAIEQDADTIIKGAKYAMEIANAKELVFAIKAKHKKAFEILEQKTKSDKNITVFDLVDMYPAGDERVVVREILKKELQPGELPLKYGAVVCNVETVKNIALAIDEGKPVIDKDITVSGRVNKAIVKLDVPIGTPLSELINEAEGFIEPCGEIVAGGPFTGSRATTEQPVVKTTGGILVGMPFPQIEEKYGLLGCECGGQIDRLAQIAESMGGTVSSTTNCKRMIEDKNGRLRCDLPGECPGQAQSVMKLKKEGATAILMGSCEAWANTVMNIAPKLGLKVVHSTDHILRATGHSLYRKK